MKYFTLDSTQTIHRPIEEVFAFFSDPKNLEELTPDFLRFQVLQATHPEIEEGTEIDYALRLRGIPVRWRSRILKWDPPFSFVDEQVRGPYRKWHHRHTFQDLDGATLVRDHVTYAVLGGAMVNRCFVRRDLERIFDHRRAQLARRFPKTHLASIS